MGAQLARKSICLNLRGVKKKKLPAGDEKKGMIPNRGGRATLIKLRFEISRREVFVTAKTKRM